MSKSYQYYKNVIYVHHSELSALIMKFDEIGLEYLEDRKECAIYFNEYDYRDKYKLINTIGEWENNPNALNKEKMLERLFKCETDEEFTEIDNDIMKIKESGDDELAKYLWHQLFMVEEGVVRDKFNQNKDEVN